MEVNQVSRTALYILPLSAKRLEPKLYLKIMELNK